MANPRAALGVVAWLLTSCDATRPPMAPASEPSPPSSVVAPAPPPEPVPSAPTPSSPPSPIVASAPLPADPRRAWLDECEARLRRAAAALASFGPIVTWRDRASHSTDSYDVFIHAAAAKPSLVEGSTPHPDDDAIVFALGRSLEFRVVLVAEDCRAGAWPRDTPWADRLKYWDPNEMYREARGVSAAIHVDHRVRYERTRAFIEAFRPVVDACLERRPLLEPARVCDPTPG